MTYEEFKKKHADRFGLNVQSDDSDTRPTDATAFQQLTQSTVDLSKDVQSYYSKWHGGDESRQAYAGYQSRISNLLSHANRFKKQYAGNTDAITHIDSVVSSLKEMQDYSYKRWEDYSRFATEDEYNTAVEAMQEYYDTWGHYKDRDDFAARSTKRDYTNPTDKDLAYYDAMMDSSTWHTDAQGHLRDVHGNYIPHTADEKGNIIHPLQDADRFVVNDPLGYFLSKDKDYRENLVYGGNGKGKAFETLQSGVVNHWEELEEDELATYYYLLDAFGTEKAMEYLDATAETLNSRWGLKESKRLQSIENDFIRTTMTGLTGLEAGLNQWATGAAQTVTDKEIPTSGIQYASSDLSESLDGFGKYAYDATVTVGNMLPSILLSRGALGLGFGEKAAKTIGAAAMGASASGNAYNQALKEGYEEGQARWYGMLVGASEAALQRLLGGISALGGTSGKIKGMVAKIDKSLLRISAKLGVSVLSEINEEELQLFLEPAFKSIIFGEEYDAPAIDEMLETAIVTALSTGALEGGGIISQDIAQTRYNKNLYGDVQSELVAENLELGGDIGQKYQARLDNGKNLNGHQLARLAEANKQILLENDISKIANAVEKRLTELGESGDVSSVATAIAKQVAGETLSRSERKSIQSSKHSQGVLNELNAQNIRSGLFDTDWTGTLETDRVNPDLYNRLMDAAVENVVRSESAPAQAAEEVISSQKASVSAVTTLDASEDAAGDDAAKNATKLPAQNQNASEGKYKASADGSTFNLQTGESVAIKEIAHNKNGKMVLRLEDGSTVDAQKVSYPSKNEAILYESVAKMGVDAATANAIVSNYDPSGELPAVNYVEGVKEAYRYGLYGFDPSEVARGVFARDLSPIQKKVAYDLGTVAKTYRVAQEQRSAQKAVVPAPVGSAKVHLDVDKKSLKARQKVSIKALESLSDTLNVNIHVFESRKVGKNFVYTNEKGEVVPAPNGYYDPATRTIHLDLNAGDSGKGTMLYTAAHELAHDIRKWSPEKFQTLAEFLFEQYAEKGVSVDRLAKAQIEKAKAKGRTISYDTAVEEVVADSLSVMFTDTNAAEKIAMLKEKDQGLYSKIKKFFKDMLAKIKAVYAGLNPDSAEGQLVGEMKDALERISDLFAEAAVDAATNYQNSINDMVAYDAKSQSVAPMFSERTWTASEYVTAREETAKAIAKQLGVSVAEATKYIDDINSVARLIADDRVRLDYDPNIDDTASVLKPNSDYKWSVDMSTLCAKRLLFTGTFDAIQRRLPHTAFSSDDIVRLRSMMEERGYEVACGICYVESTRREIGTITAGFIERYKEAQRNGKPIARINSKGEEVALTKEGKTFAAEDGYTPTLADLNTTDIDRVKRDHREVYEAYLAYMNARGQAKPKLLETRAEYKGEILKHFKAKSAVKSRNAAGGLRLQSFSDFEVAHLIDMMQIVMDMSRVGLKSQAYTKVPAFAEAFGNTGIKINLSLIAKGTGLDKNGNLVFDDVEGINHEEAFKLREKFSKNVGTILVGKSDAHIIAAMADPRIDFIIPFHKSSWKESLYEALGLTGYDDYTDFQNEKAIDSSKISNYNPSEYWDYSKTGDENAQIYLQKCREDGRIPKFPQFQGYSGYWKLLIDFKMYDNAGVRSPQEVVRPVFDNATNEAILKEYEGGHRSLPVAQDVVDDFISEYEKKDAVKYSARTTRDSQQSARYSLRGVNKDGIEVYETSDEIKALPYKERKDRFLAIMENDYRGRTAKFIRNGHAYYATFDEEDVNKNIYGDKRSDKKGWKAKINVGADGNIFELVENAQYNGSNPEKGKKIAAHRGVGYWDYFIKNVQIDGTVFDLVANVRKKADGAFVYSIQLNENKEKEASPPLDSLLRALNGVPNASTSIVPQDPDPVKFSDRSYAPTFYSQMGKVVDAIKPQKMGAGGVVPYLKGKGIKNEEIKWSGIEAFLEGKKSVTKEELQEFVAGSMLQIEEEQRGNSAPVDEFRSLMSDVFEYGYDPNDFDDIVSSQAYSAIERLEETLDEMVSKKMLPRNRAERILSLANKVFDSDTMPAKWDHYKLDGGTNYRELLFTLPNSSYSNAAMETHWGYDAQGILAHARIQDFENEYTGWKTLFIEEIQSDWHNQGHLKGYDSEISLLEKEEFSNLEKVIETLSEQHDSIHEEKQTLDFDYFKGEKMPAAEYYDKAAILIEKLEKITAKLNRSINKREELFSKIKNFVPDAPFRGTYHEYVLKRLIRMASEEGYDSIGWTTAATQVERWSDKYAEGYRIEYDQDIPKFLRKYGKKWGATVEKSSSPDGTEIWSMDITDSMKESVLYEGQVIYSDRNHDGGVSNRSLLANALESAAQNDIERKRIREYQAKIAAMDQEEAHLSEIRAEIKELSFAKGRRDMAKIRALQDEATKIANRIDTYDKQLLRLEASKPLENVLQREKDRARKQAEEKYEQQKAELRTKAAKREKAMQERYQESRKKAVEGRNKTAIRHKIKKFKENMERKLLHPTDRQYVPVALVEAMVDVCNLINTDTPLYKKDGSLNKAQDQREKTKEKLQHLKNEYEKFGKDSDPNYQGEFDEVVYDYLGELLEKYGGQNLNDMSLSDLTEMYDMLRAIDETLSDARKLIGWGDAVTVFDAADAIVAEQGAITGKRKNAKRSSAQKALDNIDRMALSPVRYVEKIAGYHQDSSLLKLFKKFEQGVRKKNMFVMKSYKLFDELSSGKEYEDAVYEEFGGKKYVDVNGREFGLSKMQMMQAILSYEREVANNLNHIISGGFTFADLDLLRKGKLKDAVSAEHDHRVPVAVRLVEEFSAALKDDAWCQKYMETARKFFNEDAKDAINETMLVLKHRIVAKDKNYIPYEVDRSFVNQEISAEQNIQQTINSYGMLKDLKDGAPQPLIITGLNNVIDRHIEMVGNVYGLAIEVRNFNKVWNAKSTNTLGKRNTVKAAITENWGRTGSELVEQAVKDIQGARIRERSAVYDFVKRNYIKATFALNLSVVTKQIGSLFTSRSVLKYRNPFKMIANLIYTMGHTEQIAAEVDQYTASAWMRRRGLSDAEVATLMTQAAKNRVGRLWSKLPTVINPTKWVTAMDHAVALSLWKYAKQDTAKETGLEGEELLKATAAYYDEVVENTQSMTDVLHRPEIQKKGGVVAESVSMFKTDLYQMAGQLRTVTSRYAENKTKENSRALVRTVSSVLGGALWAQLATVAFNLIRYSVKRYRDDDDEEVTIEEILKRFGMGMMGDLAGYLFPLFGSETIGILENWIYGESDALVDNIAIDFANDLYTTMTRCASSLKDGEMPSATDMEKIVTKSLQLFGLPANNAWRIVKAINLHAKDIANGEFLSFEAGADRAPKHHMHRVIEAVDAGHLSAARGLYEDALDEIATEKADGGEYGDDEKQEAASALKSALGTKYKDREVTKSLAEQVMSDILGMSDDDIYWTMDKWDYAIVEGSSDGYAKYDEFFEAVETGKNLNTVVKQYKDNGVSDKTLASQITSHFKPLYLNMTTREKANLKGYLLNAYVLCGSTRDDAMKRINKWK